MIEHIGDTVLDLTNTKGRHDEIRRIAADALSSGLPIGRIKDLSGHHSVVQIEYHMRTPDVVVEMWRDHGVGRLAEILERNAAVIARHEASDQSTLRIERSDVVAIAGTGNARHLADACGDFKEPLRIEQGQACEGAKPEPDRQIPPYLDYGPLKRGAHRIHVRLAEDAQRWNDRTLAIRTKSLFPASVVTSMVGRRVDEIVAETMLSGSDLVVAKAWSSSGTLGLTFASDLIRIDEAMAIVDRRTRIAA